MSYKRAYEILQDWAPQKLCAAAYAYDEQDRCVLGVLLPTKVIPEVVRRRSLNGLDVAGIARHEDGIKARVSPGGDLDLAADEAVVDLQNRMLAAWYAAGLTLDEAVMLQEQNDQFGKGWDDGPPKEVSDAARYAHVLNFLRYQLELEAAGIPLGERKWNPEDHPAGEDL